MNPWEISFEGHVWPETTYTSAEAVDVSRLTGGQWDRINPNTGPESLVAVVAVLCSTRLGEDLNDAIARVKMMPITDLVDCLQPMATETAAA